MRKTQLFTGLLAAALSVLPTLSGRSTKPKPAVNSGDARLFQKKLSKDKQALHALERLTFGPRPGDVQHLAKTGLKKWLDQQLHPERIKENPLLAAKLKPLESLRMTQEEVVRSYPPPQLIAAVATGREKLPDDPVTRAAVERLLVKYRAKKGVEQSADELETKAKITDILSDNQISILRKGTLDEKRQLITSLSESKLEDLIIALPKPQRQQLLNLVPEEMRRKIMLMNAPQAVLNYDLTEGKLYRAMYSNRQLQELLTDFWYNHFNVFLDKGADRYLVPTYERESIRPNVLGTSAICWKPPPRVRRCCFTSTTGNRSHLSRLRRTEWPNASGRAAV